MSTHVIRKQILATEECWPEHNQHPRSNFPKPEFTAFLTALTASAPNTPRVPILKLTKAGPSTAAPSLRVRRSSWPHTRLQTLAAPFQAIPKANPTSTPVPALAFQQSLLQDQVDVRHVNQPTAPPPTQADVPALP